MAPVGLHVHRSTRRPLEAPKLSCPGFAALRLRAFEAAQSPANLDRRSHLLLRRSPEAGSLRATYDKAALSDRDAKRVTGWGPRGNRLARALLSLS